MPMSARLPSVKIKVDKPWYNPARLMPVGGEFQVGTSLGLSGIIPFMSFGVDNDFLKIGDVARLIGIFSNRITAVTTASYDRQLGKYDGFSRHDFLNRGRNVRFLSKSIQRSLTGTLTSLLDKLFAGAKPVRLLTSSMQLRCA